MNHTIDLDEYVLEVEITMLIDTPPDPSCRDSDWDFYGCREMEFSVVSGKVFDEDGNESDIGRNGCAAVAEMHAELIEEMLWKIVDAEKHEARFGGRAA